MDHRRDMYMRVMLVVSIRSVKPRPVALQSR